MRKYSGFYIGTIDNMEKLTMPTTLDLLSDKKLMLYMLNLKD